MVVVLVHIRSPLLSSILRKVVDSGSVARTRASRGRLVPGLLDHLSLPKEAKSFIFNNVSVRSYFLYLVRSKHSIVSLKIVVKSEQRREKGSYCDDYEFNFHNFARQRPLKFVIRLVITYMQQTKITSLSNPSLELVVNGI